jgi:beta-glucanase (GH16 family)
MRYDPSPRPRSVASVALVLSALASSCSSKDTSSSTPDAALGGTRADAGGASSGAGGSGNAGPASHSGGSPGSAASAGGRGGALGSGGTSASAGTAGSAGSAGAGVTPANDAGSGADAGRPGWTLVFSDEFNGPSGTGVDATKWNLVNKGDGFGNNELEFYTNRANNAAMDGQGSLVIHVIKEQYMGRAYTSARLESNGKFERAYGRVEARIKVPRGQGIWPAFWMLGNNIGSVGWPTCGEIDIMENIGKEPAIVHGSLHGPGYSGGNPLGAAYTLPGGQKFADAFHVFAVEWETNVIRFYVDDHLYETRTPADVPAGARWVYDHPFYLLLNVAVGGQWPGSPDQTTVFPQTMSVDYVRVYGR